MEAALACRASSAFTLVGIRVSSQREAIDRLLAGLPASAWGLLADAVGVSDQRLAEAVNISIATLTRRKREGRFTPEESDRLLRIAGLAARAESVFTVPERRQAWFSTPNQQLGGESPLSYARTSIGAAEVARLLERILDGSPA